MRLEVRGEEKGVWDLPGSIRDSRISRLVSKAVPSTVALEVAGKSILDVSVTCFTVERIARWRVCWSDKGRR